MHPQAAVSILKGQGFTYSVPSRAKGNQLYVPELDRIVLKVSSPLVPGQTAAPRVRRAAMLLGAAPAICQPQSHMCCFLACCTV